MKRKPSGWTSRYWDILDQVYWVPDYIGLKSIPKKFWQHNGDRVSVPREMTNPDGPLYRRLRKGDEYWDYIQSREETFNHLFDLTFGILPGDVIGAIFSPLTKSPDSHSFELLGHALNVRFGWPAMDNTTQADSFFISREAILMVELKFNAVTNRDQLTKYILDSSFKCNG